MGLTDISCHSGGKVTVRVEILSSNNPNYRMLRNNMSVTTTKDYALNLFYKLRDVSSNEMDSKSQRRELVDKDLEWSFKLSNMKILPSALDVEKFKTHPDLEKEEKELRNIALLETNVGATDANGRNKMLEESSQLEDFARQLNQQHKMEMKELLEH